MGQIVVISLVIGIKDGNKMRKCRPFCYFVTMPVFNWECYCNSPQPDVKMLAHQENLKTKCSWGLSELLTYACITHRLMSGPDTCIGVLIHLSICGGMEHFIFRLMYV